MTQTASAPTIYDRPKMQFRSVPDDFDLEDHFRTRRKNGVLLIVFLFVVGSVLLLLGSLMHGFSSPPQAGSITKPNTILTIVEFLLSHFGIAFIVASCAGIGYEFFAHYKHLQDQIVTLFKINHEVAQSQLYAVLAKLIPVAPVEPGTDAGASNKLQSDLRNDIADTVLAIAKIKAQRINASDVSIKFIWRLQRYARDAAAALEAMDDHILKLPRTSAALADEILAGQAASMVDGDTYDVVSDFSTWKSEQLPLFWTALKTSIEQKNVRVRRVFCFFPYDAYLTVSEVIEILRSHWCLAETTFRNGTGRYDVAVSFRHDNHHIGIFSLRGQWTCFKPMSEGDLSILTVSRASDMQEFDRQWSGAIHAFEYAADGKGIANLLTFTALRQAIEKRDPKYFSFFKGLPDARDEPHGDCECWQMLKNGSATIGGPQETK